MAYRYADNPDAKRNQRQQGLNGKAQTQHHTDACRNALAAPEMQIKREIMPQYRTDTAIHARQRTRFLEQEHTCRKRQD